MSWSTMDQDAPENVPLLLQTDRGLRQGYCSRRFLRGTPTYWATIEGKIRLVFPRRWRVVSEDSPNGGLSLAHGSDDR